MEPEGIGGPLGAVVGAMGTLVEPQTAITINQETPVSFRPLRFAAVGRLIDMHPTEIESLRLEDDPSGQPQMLIRFGPDVAAWIAGTIEMAVGQRMLVFI